MKRRLYTAKDNMFRAIKREGFSQLIEIRSHETFREPDGRKVYEPELIVRTQADKYRAEKRGFRASLAS